MNAAHEFAVSSLRGHFSWGEFLDTTPNSAPDFGRLGTTIDDLQGFSGHGLPVAGKLVAEAPSGQAERFDLLSRIRYRRFPGGAFMRGPALAPGMLYDRLRDLL